MFYNETYIIWCVPAQIPHLGKISFLRYGPKCSQPIRLQDFLINHISRTNQQAYFLYVDISSHKLKVDQKIFWWTWSKMDMASLVTGLWNWLYLKTELMEWTELLHAGTNSGKLKVILMIFEWACSEMGMAI